MPKHTQRLSRNALTRVQQGGDLLKKFDGFNRFRRSIRSGSGIAETPAVRPLLCLNRC